MTLTPAERRLRSLLHILVFAFIVAALIYGAGPLVGLWRSFFRQLPFVSNSVVKVSVMGLLGLYAWGDVRGRRSLVAIVIAGHLISVAAAAIVLVSADTGRIALAGLSVGTVLWRAIVLDGGITLLLLAFYLSAGRARAGARKPAAPEPTTLTPAERRVRGLAIGFGVLFGAAAAAYEIGLFVPSTRGFFVELPFVTNSVV